MSQTATDTAMEKQKETPTWTGRPSQRFFHANPKGTGSAISLELHPAHDRVDGSIMLSMASQMTIGDMRGPHPTYPTFDWEGKLTVKLDFSDLAKMLQVFRGECESLADGHGLYHRSPNFSTRIVLRHLIEPTPCYSLELYRTSPHAEDKRVCFVFSPWEAMGLSEAIAGSLAVIAFGIPMVIAHDTSEYRAAVREMRHAAVA